MHQRYPSGHSTPRKINRKIELASSADEITTGQRRLPIAVGTETTKTWPERKRNSGDIKSKDLVWSGLVWSGLVWSGLVWSGCTTCGAEENIKMNDVIYKSYDPARKGQRWKFDVSITVGIEINVQQSLRWKQLCSSIENFEPTE
ncbi:hypothetical protein HELRODRAFT_171033 [Helobdella robusta]|uniref:Uncharacterized protein n=1 Tax=Helobdella robusta TaxID=6412 RepID=T1F3Q6_HELRO|nr:hypothetical protein HELRODRAFT_171033 [Helobdella robusta]ESO06997.1 hypothetical protein HELRODRAFT_171033 [Helobdella robusta]